MTKRVIKGLLGVALVLAVALLATHAVSHWHTLAGDEQHCQVCHVGHAAVPQPTTQVAAQAPIAVARLTPAEDFHLDLEESRSLSIPRAPPA